MNKRNVGNKSPGAHSTPECILRDVDWLKYEIFKYDTSSKSCSGKLIKKKQINNNLQA